MVITKDIISFAMIDDEEELDRILFVDVDHIKDSNAENPVKNDASGFSQESLRVAIVTKLDGDNSGRTYYLKTDDVDTHRTVMKALIHNCKLKKEEQTPLFNRMQEMARRMYEHNIFQALVAFIIISVSAHDDYVYDRLSLGSFVVQSFACTLIESQLGNRLNNPDGSSTSLKIYLDQFNTSFTIIFTAELIANAFSYWLIPFLSNGWCSSIQTRMLYASGSQLIRSLVTLFGAVVAHPIRAFACTPLPAPSPP